MDTLLDSSHPQAPSEPNPAVQTWELSKVYRTGFWLNNKVASLNKLSLTIYKGETFGLLGPNGAGKTTLLKILLGIVRPSSGKAMVLSKPLGNQGVKQSLGYLPENAYFYNYLTAKEFLHFNADLFKIPASVVKKRIPELLDLVGLGQKTARTKQLRQYSKGMLQRVGMAQALINDPELVFLDEPMSGLDPTGRYQIREIILSLKEQGKTIFFNSHVLGDVEKICDRIAILNQGKLVCLGTLDELLGVASGYRVVGKGGNPQILQRWVKDLSFQKGAWHGELRGEPHDFLASLELMDAQLISMHQAFSTFGRFLYE